MNIIKLNCFKQWRKVHWNNDNLVINKLKALDEIDLDELDKDELKTLITELDRRFVQLWDKVVFENKKDQL